MADRRLSPDEAALWRRVMTSVRPLPDRQRFMLSPPLTAPIASRTTVSTVRLSAPQPTASPQRKAPVPGATLDASWDRKLARGLVSPDRTVDLHGHGLNSAYLLLDQQLADAIGAGDRLILLVTGKPPPSASQRPHARGAIRAAVGDWLAASRHGDRIAAVRGAHPRHGGTGALYIILRRARQVS
ncbi:Smr/MutS family protein [Sphingomonas sp.]|uniref:Smr/MutS family protein n=1 Tax=Sphingomonas sp. TaxID=28214 RepID=UPI002DD6894B|nr:Smr/MutS family protein [Sphingomonas sp.]